MYYFSLSEDNLKERHGKDSQVAQDMNYNGYEKTPLPFISRGKNNTAHRLGQLKCSLELMCQNEYAGASDNGRRDAPLPEIPE